MGEDADGVLESAGDRPVALSACMGPHESSV